MRQAEKGGKKFQSRILLILDPGKKILKKNSKNLKNLFPVLFLTNTGLDRPRKGEKNFSPEFRSYSTLARKFQKKQQKNSKNLKKPISGISFSQNGMRQAKNGRKKFQPRIPFILNPVKKISKKIAKKFKIIKNHYPALSLAKMG